MGEPLEERLDSSIKTNRWITKKINKITSSKIFKKLPKDLQYTVEFFTLAELGGIFGLKIQKEMEEKYKIPPSLQTITCSLFEIISSPRYAAYTIAIASLFTQDKETLYQVGESTIGFIGVHNYVKIIYSAQTGKGFPGTSGYSITLRYLPILYDKIKKPFLESFNIGLINFHYNNNIYKNKNQN